MLNIEIDIEPWTCPKCSEKNTRTYIHCGNCGYRSERFNIKNVNGKYLSENKYDKVYKIFGKKKVFLSVLYATNVKTAVSKAEIIFEDNLVDGIFLINTMCESEILFSSYKFIRDKYPKKWIGVNFVAESLYQFFGKYYDRSYDGIWTDNAQLTNKEYQNDALLMINQFERKAFGGLYFGGICVRKMEADKTGIYIDNACRYTDILTISNMRCAIDRFQLE